MIELVKARPGPFLDLKGPRVADSRIRGGALSQSRWISIAGEAKGKIGWGWGPIASDARGGGSHGGRWSAMTLI
jgi:hypothetical protein